MTIEQLSSSLQAHEEKKKMNKDIPKQLLKMDLQSTKKDESFNNKKNQHRRCRGQVQDRVGDNNNNNYEWKEISTRGYQNLRHDKSQVMYYNCNKFGHFQKIIEYQRTKYMKELTT